MQGALARASDVTVRAAHPDPGVAQRAESRTEEEPAGLKISNPEAVRCRLYQESGLGSGR